MQDPNDHEFPYGWIAAPRDESMDCLIDEWSADKLVFDYNKLFVRRRGTSYLFLERRAQYWSARWTTHYWPSECWRPYWPAQGIAFRLGTYAGRNVRA